MTTKDMYSNIIERSIDGMLGVYSYAPRQEGISIYKSRIDERLDILLRQAEQLLPGQSTENLVMQSGNVRIDMSSAYSDIAKHITSSTGSNYAYVTGSRLDYELKAQATRSTEGLTIHTSFNTKYGGDGYLIASALNADLYDDDVIESRFHSIATFPIATLLREVGYDGLNGNQAEFVKKARDNDLIPGVDLSSLSDEEIDEAFKSGTHDPYHDVIDFILRQSNLSRLELFHKIASAVGAAKDFDLSQLSFNFDYDIEIVDEDTEQSTNNAHQTGSTIFTPTVIKQINTFVKEDLYDDRIHEFEIEKSSEFDKVIQDAESGQNEFELNIDLDDVEDVDIFESIHQHFFSGYNFDYEYQYITRITLRIDREAKTLEVEACLVLAHYSGLTPAIEGFVVYDGEVVQLEDYIYGLMEGYEEDEYEEYDQDEDGLSLYDKLLKKVDSDFINAETYDPSSTYVSTVISLDN